MSNNNKQLFVGIDVSKYTLDICYAGDVFKISNDEKSIASFITDNLLASPPRLIVLESTGGYERLVKEQLQHFSMRVHTAHPNRVHAFAKACNHFAKTDRLDAILLEKYAAFIDHEVKIDQLSSKSISELKELRLLQKSLESELHAYQCRSQYMRGCALTYVQSHISQLKELLKQLLEEINGLINEDDKLRENKAILNSFKGVGEKVSNILLIECSELGSLSKPAIVSLVGLAPKTKESGKQVCKARITGGRFYVRRALYMAALVAIRFNHKMKEIYQKHIKKGKVFKVAIVAVMRKIIINPNIA